MTRVGSLVVLAYLLEVARALLSPVPTSACHLPSCTCLQFTRLHCTCTQAHQLMELKNEGFGYLPKHVTTITVEKCNKVIVFPMSIQELTSLRRVEFKTIGNIVLHEKALSWGTTDIKELYEEPGISIEIVNSSAASIPSQAFLGRIDYILFQDSNIDNVRHYAFSNLAGTQRIKFQDTVVQAFESHSFKKFIVDQFIIDGGYFGMMNSYMLKDIVVKEEMKIQNLEVGLTQSLSVMAEGPQALRIKGCFFKQMEEECLKVSTRGPVFIEDNIFSDIHRGAFIGLSLDPRHHMSFGSQELIFENNTLINFQEGALTFNSSGLNPSVDRVVIKQECVCSDINNWGTKLVKFTTQKSSPNVTKLIWCLRKNTDLNAVVFYHKHCEFTIYTLYWIIGIILGAVLFLGVCLAAILMLRKYRKMYREVESNRNSKNNENRISTYSTNSAHIIVMPGSKTYKETELDLFQEQTEPLKLSNNDVSSLKVTGL